MSYEPTSIGTSSVRLSKEEISLTGVLARNVHKKRSRGHVEEGRG